jgi:hypothetical protein
MSDASHLNIQLHNAGATPQLQSLACSAFGAAQQRSSHTHTRTHTHTDTHIHTRTQVRLFRYLTPPTSTQSCTMRGPCPAAEALQAALVSKSSSTTKIKRAQLLVTFRCLTELTAGQDFRVRVCEGEHTHSSRWERNALHMHTRTHIHYFTHTFTHTHTHIHTFTHTFTHIYTHTRDLRMKRQTHMNISQTHT